MSDLPNKTTPSPGELSEADERAIDALLIEALRPHAPHRDFTCEILAQLDQKTVRLPRRDEEPQSQRSSGTTGTSWVITAVVAVVAASVLCILLARAPLDPTGQVAQPDNGTQGSAAPRAGELAGGSRVGPPTAPQGGNPGQPSGDNESALASRPPRKPPVVLSEGLSEADPSVNETQPDLSRNADLLATPSAPRPLSTGAELADFNRQFTAYWKAIGVTPAPQIEQSEWLDRVAERFGWQPDPTAQPPAMDDAFTDSEASRALAQRLVDQLIVGIKPSSEQRERLIQEAADVIASGGRFDVWLSGWITDDALVSAGDHANDPTLVGEWVSNRVIGADVSCAKCHDSPVDSRYVQHDFWAMAALFSSPSSPPLFYELEDGRQSVAVPGIPRRWFGLPPQALQSRENASRAELAALMVGSPQLARTLANHLWTIGFGEPLVAAASSPLAPPRDERLDQALAMLGDRLLSENFDIRSAAKWIIDCDPMKRGVPEDLADDRWQVVDQSKLIAASLAQRTFAAAKAPVPQPSRNQLLAVMQARGGLIPATLAAPDSLLAQPRPFSPQSPSQALAPRQNSPSARAEVKEVDLADYWWTQWLADREELQDNWLESIRQSDQQLLHAFYAAGYRDIDSQQLESAKKLLEATQDSQQDQSETATQIHWILENSK